jgi:hypothetical protein
MTNVNFQNTDFILSGGENLSRNDLLMIEINFCIKAETAELKLNFDLTFGGLCKSEISVLTLDGLHAKKALQSEI